jgi:lipopolysaccharide transport system ATP-binding protein
MSSNIAIKVESLSKCYQIYDTPRDRLKQFFLPRLQQVAGKSAKQYYKEYWALKDISFEIKKGETVGIIGRNGSGKSTLLQMICGTLNPTSGSVQTNGRIAALLELGSGFNPEFTGRENVYMNAALLGLSKDETDERYRSIIEFADIGDFINQPVKTYSSGMFVRLAFAVNIISDPDIIIIDEALAVGDIAFQAKCMTALREIQDRGSTVLFVSHDISAIKSLCDRAAYIDNGKLILLDKASDVVDYYMQIMRQKINSSNVIISEPNDNMLISDSNSFNETNFSVKMESFSKEVKNSRYGTGEARVIYVEMVNSKSEPLKYVEFNQKVTLKIYIDAIEQKQISCNYYIADEKKIYVLGCGFLRAGVDLLQTERGGRYIVTFETYLPLKEGNYSLQIELTTPVELDKTAVFLDVIKDALLFSVLERKNGKVWSQVYLPNDVKILKVL